MNDTPLNSEENKSTTSKLNMKDEYLKLEGSLQDLYNNVHEMTSTCKGPVLTKLGTRIERLFVTVNHNLQKVEAFIPIVDPIALKNEWGGDEFYKAWQFYKDYLKEQHCFVMRSRMELMRIKVIRNLCNDNVAMAIRLLEFLMAHGSITVYAAKELSVEKNQKTEDDESKTERKNNVSLPFPVRKK